MPPEALASSTALSMAGLAASTSPRSTGTRIVLNMGLASEIQPWRVGVWTTRPSSSGRTRIWHDSREFGRTSKAKSSMSSSIGCGWPGHRFPFLGHIDVTGGAGAGSAAFGLDARDAVADGGFHHGRALLRLDGAGRSFGIDERNLDHCGPLLVGRILKTDRAGRRETSAEPAVFSPHFPRYSRLLSR